MHARTAAHRTLPLGTRLRVTNLANGKSVDVRINDRGPAIRSRIIDVSHGVAVALDAVATGVSFRTSAKTREATSIASRADGAPT